MCWPHWRGLPRRLKDAIFETFRNGPRADYVANVKEAVRLIEEKERAAACKVPGCFNHDPRVPTAEEVAAAGPVRCPGK